MYVCAGVEARGLHWKTSIYCVQTTSAVVPHLVFSDKILHGTQYSKLTRLTEQQTWMGCFFCPPFLGLHVNVTICGFSAGAGDQNLSLHTHMTGILPTRIQVCILIWQVFYQRSLPSRPSAECLCKRKTITSLKMKVPWQGRRLRL